MYKGNTRGALRFRLVSVGIFLVITIGKAVRVLFRPQKPLDVPVERFFASLRFEQRRKLDQLGIEIDAIDWKA